MIDITQAIISLQPNAVFSCKNNDYNKIKWVDESIVKPSYEEVLAEIKRLEGLEPMRLLKEERNRLLAETDWRFRIDLEPNQAWYEYCQALRDLPLNSDPQLDENGQLTNVTWPEKPNA